MINIMMSLIITSVHNVLPKVLMFLKPSQNIVNQLYRFDSPSIKKLSFTHTA